MSFCHRLTLVVWSAASLGASPISFRSTELPRAAIGADYRAAIETQGDGRCALGDVVILVVGGVLPEGLRIQGDAITGAPKEVGTFPFRIRAANNCASAEREFQLEVTGKPILRVSPQELVFEYRLDDPAPTPKTALVSSTWPELSYCVMGAPNWLRVRLRAGVTPYPGSAFASDVATIEVIPQDLKPGSYETNLLFVAPLGGTPAVVPVRLKISAPVAPAAQTAK
jgi:hypothetical protein